MADFATLGLVTPSKKKKPVSDKNEYWTLTKRGQDVLSAIRLMTLEKPLNDQEQLKAPKDDPNSQEQSKANLTA